MMGGGGTGGGGGNRVEAGRWLATAEKLLAAGDLHGAKNFAIRASESDATLSDTTQLILAVAETLLVGDSRVGDTHLPDWYGILRLIRLTHNPELVANQYSRLAVLLNPNRNRLPYADQAFRLVSDAWYVLSDPSRKALYDRDLQLSQFGHLGQLGFQLFDQPTQTQPQTFSFQTQQPHQPQQTLSFQLQHQQSPPSQQHFPVAQHLQVSQPQQHRHFYEQQLPQQQQLREGSQPVEGRLLNLNSATERTQPVHPQEPDLPSWPFETAQPPRTIETAKSTRSSETILPSETIGSSEPTRPPELILLTEPIQTSEPIRPPEPAQPLETSRTSDRVRPSKPTRPQEPTQVPPGSARAPSEPARFPSEPARTTSMPAQATFLPAWSPLEPTRLREAEKSATEFRVPSFWTACPYCFVLYEYPEVYEDCTLRCQTKSCMRAFQAVKIPSAPPVTDNNVNYCCWGFFPIGFSGKAKVSGGFVPNWTPKRSAPRVYYDDDDLFVEISDPSEEDEDDDDWRSYGRKKTKPKRRKGKASAVNYSGKKRGRPKKIVQNPPVTQTMVDGRGGGSVGQMGMVAGPSSGGGNTARGYGRKRKRVGGKDLGKLDLNVEFSSEVETSARSEGTVSGNEDEDCIKGTEFFEGLDEFFSTLPIISSVADDKVKATE